jgi:serine/threonine protein kinase
VTRNYETIHLRSELQGDLDKKGANDFAAVRVGGAIDGYRVVENLAEGGMGAVFRVQDREGQGEVALKTPLPGGRGGTYHHRMQRFLREARLTSRMDHDGVARVRDQGQCDGLPYFTVDLVDGKPLSDRLYEEGVLPVREALEIVEKTSRAAHHVHQKGVIHRDLKPANILIKPDGTPVIIDFGLARDALGIDPRITDSGIWLGTPAYIAPEQALGEASRVDPRADVYSLGAILFELMTGLPPFGVGRPRTIFRALRESEVRPPSELRPEIPAAVDRLVLIALSRSSRDRFPNAEAFANAIADLLRDLEVDDVENSALECSWQSERSDTVRGWNEPDVHTSGHDASDLAFPALEDIPEETPRRRKSRSRNKARVRRQPSKQKVKVRKGKARRPMTRRTTRRPQGGDLDVLARYLAFGGPALVALVGLLLLIA